MFSPATIECGNLGDDHNLFRAGWSQRGNHDKPLPKPGTAWCVSEACPDLAPKLSIHVDMELAERATPSWPSWTRSLCVRLVPRNSWSSRCLTVKSRLCSPLTVLGQGLHSALSDFRASLRRKSTSKKFFRGGDRITFDPEVYDGLTCSFRPASLQREFIEEHAWESKQFAWSPFEESPETQSISIQNCK